MAIFTFPKGRSWLPTVLLMALAATLATSTAEAFWKKKAEVEAPRRAVNLDQYPTMAFYRGQLQRGSFSSWELDGRPLSFLPETVVSTSDQRGGTSLLREGRSVMVQGYGSVEGLVVYQMTMYDTDQLVRDNRFVAKTVLTEPKKMPAGAPR